MAVYTELTENQIGTLLRKYDLGELSAYQGASDGIENTTYFVQLVTGEEFVVTLFEFIEKEVLPFHIELTSTLCSRGLPVPSPLMDNNGQVLQTLAGKPALMFPRVAGNHILQPSLQEVDKVAVFLGNMHLQCLDIPLQHPNPKSLNWMHNVWESISSSLSDEDNKLIEEQILLRQQYQLLDLPRAVIHADLFRDNVLFRNGEVTGVIDFYNAGTDSLLLDIAIAVFDWCVNTEGLLDAEKSKRFIESYQTKRGLSVLEQDNWIIAQQLAATLFWLSRLEVNWRAEKGIQLAVKDPMSCKKILLQHLGRL